MALSVGETIVAAMVAALNAPSGKPATCFRTRVDAFAVSELPAFVLYSLRESGKRQGRNVSVRNRTVRLEILVAGTPPADALIDPLFVYAIQTFYADANLAAIIARMEDVSVVWETDPGYDAVSVAAIDFEVDFVVTATDPTVQIQTGVS